MLDERCERTVLLLQGQERRVRRREAHAKVISALKTAYHGWLKGVPGAIADAAIESAIGTGTASAASLLCTEEDLNPSGNDKKSQNNEGNTVNCIACSCTTKTFFSQILEYYILHVI